MTVGEMSPPCGFSTVLQPDLRGTEHADFIKINQILPATMISITIKTRLIARFIQGFAPDGTDPMPLV